MASCRAAGSFFAPAVQHIGVALDDRDGGAQLVAGVGDKAGLGLVALLNALQHGVDGLGKRCQPLLLAGDRQPLAQVGGVDVVQLLRQLAQVLQVQVGAAQHVRRLLQCFQGGHHAPDGLAVLHQPNHQTHRFYSQQQPPYPAGAVEKQEHNAVQQQIPKQPPVKEAGDHPLGGVGAGIPICHCIHILFTSAGSPGTGCLGRSASRNPPRRFARSPCRRPAAPSGPRCEPGR